MTDPGAMIDLACKKDDSCNRHQVPLSYEFERTDAKVGPSIWSHELRQSTYQRRWNLEPIVLL